MENHTYYGVVTRIIDGDTVEASLNLGFGLRLRKVIRLSGINCPEKFGPDKESGLKAKARTTELAFGHPCRIEACGPDKYGREVAAVFVFPPDGGEVDLAETLVAEGLAYRQAYGLRGDVMDENAFFNRLNALFDKWGLTPKIEALPPEDYLTFSSDLRELLSPLIPHGPY